MGPVGLIVKILFYMFLVTELIFAVSIYAMATILLCSRMIIPEHILLHTTIALFLSIVTLSVIHRGFLALSHDCAFHLYWFAVIFIALLLVQFLFEMFGIREAARKSWNKQSLPIHGESFEKFRGNYSDEKMEEKNKLSHNYSIQFIKEYGRDKLPYRFPTSEELEDRKRKLYGSDQENVPPSEELPLNDVEDRRVEIIRKKVRPPLYHGSRTYYPHNHDHNSEEIDEKKRVDNEDVEVINLDINETEPDEKLTNTPLVLVFHGYSFILKMVCVALAILTGFMYQLEYV
ncbi:hypothetical protein HHI36_008866 [Cryptolaemus montrouzieri]|uniref:Uncharacterized protein n=1 Tax=Cryptolaemus montrouzieri TaxID=559131 RepID=A0ABD2MU16_9CUCU